MNLHLQNLLVQNLASSWLRRLISTSLLAIRSNLACPRLEQLRPQFIVERLEVLLDHELH